MRRKAKVDTNQPEVVRLLRRMPGVSVRVTSQVGDGFPDLVVGFRGKNFLIELKDGGRSESRKRLTEAEEKMKEAWTGQYAVCEDVGDVLLIIGFKTTGL